jgi:glycosyltransferase involved in cell wall biosynthesis
MTDQVKGLITVGIPTYNNSLTIGETIASLKRQTFSNWECFVTDDSADEATFLAAQNAIAGDARFTLIKNPNRLGAAGNWNQTLQLAKGEYFKLLCADDTLTPSALELQIAALEASPESVLCTGQRSVINSSGRTVIKNRGLAGLGSAIDRSEAIGQFISSGTNVFGEPSFALYRTKALSSVGGFGDQWSYLIDVVSYLAVLKHGSLICLDENMGAFRISNDSWSARLVKQQRKELIACIEYAASLDPENVSRLKIFSGKLRARIKTIARRIVFVVAS